MSNLEVLEMPHLTKKLTYKVKLLVFGVLLFLILRFFGVFTHFYEQDFHSDFHYPYDGNILLFVEELKEGLTPTVKPINVYNYMFIHNCSHKCIDEENKQMPVRLVYVVKSSVEHFDRRRTIRSTWGYEKRFSDVEIRTIFMLGKRNDAALQKQIDEESQKHKDIVQADFLDAYYNNTIKTMMAFKWATTYCPSSKFYMFVDDDMYVSTKNVLRFLRNPTKYPAYLKEPVYTLEKNPAELRKARQIVDFELPDDVKLLAGHVIVSKPFRHKSSKWFVPLDEYPYDKWPPYVTAGAYVLSREALRDMYFASFYTKHFRFDDIYLGLLALKVNLEPFNNDEFHSLYKLSYTPGDYKYLITSHGYEDVRELGRVWEEQKALGNA